MIGNGVDVKVTGNKATITIDLEQDFGLSASGKSRQIASTLGNVSIAPGVMLGLNAYKPVK